MPQRRRDLRCRMHLPGQHSSRGILRGFGLICSPRCSCICAPNFQGGGNEGESFTQCFTASVRARNYREVIQWDCPGNKVRSP